MTTGGEARYSSSSSPSSRLGRAFASTPVMVTAFAVFVVSGAVWLYGGVRPFSAYRWIWRGYRLDEPDDVLLPGDLVATPLPLGLGDGRSGLAIALVALAIACLSCLVGAQARSLRRVHRWDYFFVIVSLASIWTLMSVLLEIGSRQLAWHVLWLAVVGTTGCYVIATTLVRLRAGTLLRTIFWPRVFRTLPVGQIAGASVLVVVVAATGLLLGGSAWGVVQAARSTSGDGTFLANWGSYWLLMVALPLVTLAIVALLCRNIIAITEAKEAAIEARYREERFRAELVTNLTHDIRTPLTSLIAYVDLIRRLGIDDPRLTDYTAVLTRKSERLRALVSDLLDASRASAGNLPVRPQVLDLTEILSQIVGDLDDELAARGLVWHGPVAEGVDRPGAGSALIVADGEHLWRILENLLGNVLKYARPGTAVHASVEAVGEGAGSVLRLRLVNVMAQPLTLPAAELVERFARGDAARGSEGSGLGLFIADRLASLMGARLALASEGEEFTAVLDLPRPDSLPRPTSAR